MARLLLRWALSAGAFIVIAFLVPGIHVDWLAALLAAIVIGAINAVVRPLLIVLTLPLTIVTLGLFLLVLNAALFALVALLVPGFSIDGAGSAFVGSILYWLASWLINAVVSDKHRAAMSKS